MGGEQVAITGLLPSVFLRPDSICPHDSPHTTATRPFRPRRHPCPIRREAPAGSPLPQRFDLVAHSDNHGYDETAAIVEHAVGGTGWEKSLAGDGFRALGSPISHWADHGAVYHREPESGGKKIPDEGRASNGMGDGAARGTSYTYRRKKRKK